MTISGSLAALHTADPFLAIQHALASPALDPVMAVATTSCEGWALALIAIAFAFSRNPRAGPAGPRRRAVAEASGYLVALLVTGLVVQAVKRTIPEARPLAVLGPQVVRVVLEPLRAASFPSGHSAAVAALATAAVFVHRRRAWPLVLLAVLGGISRVYVGAHWAFDVLAGWLLGAAVGLAVALVARALARRADGSLPPATARTP